MIIPLINYYKYRHKQRLIINRTTNSNMASKFPQSKLPINAFIKAEQLIRSTFDRIIGAATERRDQLLVQLNDMKLNYLNREETRNKQMSDLQKLISQLMETSIQENPIVKLRENQIQDLQREQKKYVKPTPVPIPCISNDGLKSLLEQLKGFGTVEDVGQYYTERINPVRCFGMRGNKEGELNDPTGLTLDIHGNIFIADTLNRRIQIFSTAGKFLGEFGKEHLIHPLSIVLNEKWVFVSDIGFYTNAVIKFNRTNYKYICQSEKGELYFPRGLTVDTNEEVLVADCSNNRIAILNSELKLIKIIGKGKLEHPHDVKINENKIFVADTNKINNIHIFTKSGDKIRSFIKLENGTGLIYLCFDLNNNIIVSDYSSMSIQIFTMDGQLIHKIFCKSNPKGLAVDNNNNNIYCVCYDCVVYLY